MRVIATIAKTDSPIFTFFKRSSEEVAGVTPLLWGIGEDILDEKERIRCIYTNLQRLTSETLVFLCRSDEFVFTGKCEPLFEYFESIEKGAGDKELVFLCREQKPFSWLITQHFKVHFEGMPINTGCIMARAGFLCSLYRELYETNTDESALPDILTRKKTEKLPLKVHLDNNKWVLNLPAGRIDLTARLEFRENVLFYRHVDGQIQRPVCVQRGRGGNFTAILQHLGYNITDAEYEALNGRFDLSKQVFGYANNFIQDKSKTLADTVVDFMVSLKKKIL